jgi:hypothetical protein
MLCIFSRLSRSKLPTEPLARKSRPCPALPSPQLVPKRVVQQSRQFAEANAAFASCRQRRQPLAAALGQKGRLEKLSLIKSLRGSMRAAGNGSLIAVIMPHLHRSQIDGRLSLSCYAAAGLFTFALE